MFINSFPDLIQATPCMHNTTLCLLFAICNLSFPGALFSQHLTAFYMYLCFFGLMDFICIYIFSLETFLSGSSNSCLFHRHTKFLCRFLILLVESFSKLVISVINLSSKPLTPAQRSVLAKGPNFVVSPKQPPNLESITAIEAACTKLSQQDAEELRAEVNRVLRSSHPPNPT